mgnify:CR=1 FL=1
MNIKDLKSNESNGEFIGDRVYMDLDTIITGNIDHIIGLEIKITIDFY